MPLYVWITSRYELTLSLSAHCIRAIRLMHTSGKALGLYEKSIRRAPFIYKTKHCLFILHPCHGVPVLSEIFVCFFLIYAFAVANIQVHSLRYKLCVYHVRVKLCKNISLLMPEKTCNFPHLHRCKPIMKMAPTSSVSS